MLTPCELIVKQLLPAIKAATAKQLINKYNFTQQEIANYLGLTQAAISKYLSGDYSDSIKKLENSSKVSEMASKIAQNASNSRAIPTQSICQACTEYHGDGWQCRVKGLFSNECDPKSIDAFIELVKAVA